MSDFSSITEQAGAPVTAGQIADTFERYAWATRFCQGKRVLEVACGTGQGLGLLARTARSVVGCDIEPKSIDGARSTYGERIALHVASAERLPAADGAVDVVLLFEALYYLPSPEAFLKECARVLAPSGTLLITTTNKDLFDFVPSAFATRYYGAAELGPLLESQGFSCKLFGQSGVEGLPLRHWLLRPVKAVARRFGLVPKTMRGKAIIRRLVFGKLNPMPRDISTIDLPCAAPVPLKAGVADRQHRSLYVVAIRAPRPS